ncbi:TetR/AcrR family transcriptional regulator [Spiribacter halobius]|uniref:TetR/AcrR family transcriptional regulator n=1 Tax=Sediminicurvatus halobius TaxID=2182432 RepID=A0A2U2N397_9GAMM|nr:TetR/AcrR family transcriptional regulator [Spiribacter halobius]PWG63572.1 TetR/AcrR family transcriptional regulator [Spiribacter halobius]UEX79549.1 TetR/AcrR family transcriptional regulator [Spiribacter halobius]
MFIDMGERRYRMKKRAESQARTRERIVEATVALHEELGPRQTSIRAIAERAGVQRLTVYRHFPDDASLFQACTAHWLARNPPPDAAVWRASPAGEPRCRDALIAFYRYYRDTEAMWAASHRDEPDVPALQGPMQAFRAHLDAVRDELLAGFAAPLRTREVALTLRHALSFPTWQALAQAGLEDEQAAALAVAWLRGAGEDAAAGAGATDAASRSGAGGA